MKHVEEHDSLVTQTGMLLLVFALPIAATVLGIFEKLEIKYVWIVWGIFILVSISRVFWHSFVRSDNLQIQCDKLAKDLQQSNLALQSLEQEKACLEIFFKKEPPMWEPTNVYLSFICRVGVKNNSKYSTAKDVQLRLISVFGSATSHPVNALLPAVQQGESQYSTEIPPNSTPRLFEFFDLSPESVSDFKVQFSSGFLLQGSWIEHSLKKSTLSWILEIECTGENLTTKTKKFNLAFPFERGKGHTVEFSEVTS